MCLVLGELQRVLGRLRINFPITTFSERQKQLHTLITFGNRFQKHPAVMLAVGAAIRQLLPDAASVKPHKLTEWCHLQKMFAEQCRLVPFLKALFPLAGSKPRAAVAGDSSVATTEAPASFRDLR